MAPSCQITQNGGWPSRTADQIRKSPAGCAIPILSRTASPHLRAQGTTGYKTESAYFYSRAFRFATRYPVWFLLYPRLSSCVPLGVGFQRRALPSSLVPFGNPLPRGQGTRVSKGRGPQPSPFVSLGVQGEVETPWCFSSGVWGGFFSRKECAPRPCGGNRPLRE